MSPEFPTSWNWTFEGGTPASSTVQNPRVLYTSAGTFDVSLVVTNSVGDAPQVFDTLITVLAQPLVSILADKDNPCPGEEILFTATGADQYLWFDERSEDPMSEEETYTTRFFTDRSVYLLGTSSEGCQDTTSMLVELEEGADIGIVASESEICSGDTVRFTGTGGDSYIWFLEGDTISTEQSVDISFNSSAVIGVKGSASSACSGLAASELVVHEILAEISENGYILSASEGASYQWFLEDEEISEATERIYIVEESGNYSVEVTNEFGCSDISESVDIQVTGLGEPGAEVLLSVYPNPTTGAFSIRTSGSQNGLFEYTISDLAGRIVKNGTFEKASWHHDHEIQYNGEPGMYHVRVRQGVHAGIIKVIVY